MISNTTERLFTIYSNTFLQRMFFSHVWNFTLIYGPNSCLIDVLFDPILMETLVFFSNARLILELRLCNWNLTKWDILTLSSSNCRAWALKLRNLWKKQINHVLSPFCQFQLSDHFCHTFFFICLGNNSYYNSSIKGWATFCCFP